MVQVQENRMTPEQFTYWLQGMLEGNPQVMKDGLTAQQARIIQDHLDLVFTKVTPDYTLETQDESESLEIDLPDLNSTGPYKWYPLNEEDGYDPLTVRIC